MKRKKLTFRYATEELAYRIRGVEQYWPCDSLRQLGYNAPLESILTAAGEDALTARLVAEGMDQAAQSLESQIFRENN